MKVKNFKILMIFLVLLFCILGTVSATDNLSTDVITNAPNQVPTQTVNEDLSDNIQIESSSDSSNSIINTNDRNYSVSDSQNNNVNDPEIIDYYISDSTGSDDNDGSQANPFKTIQKALNSSSEGKTYNFHILEGLYKGVGNTNLTVNGNYIINFIGEGVGKTIFDGDAKFTIPGDPNPAWGGSAFWNYWVNCSGNWIMNITPGNGLINLYNFTIQNAWNDAGSSIYLCYSATVDNYATLNVTNVYFYSNHAGAGAGIRNNFGGTLYVNNCTFENGTKAQTTGNFGGAIYNNGTAIIINTLIVDNYSRWGSITNDKNITLMNCTFRRNHAYDGGSGYKNGPSFHADTGITNFFQPYAVYNITSTLINCTFEDNDQCDISNGKGDLLVDNCIFNSSTGVYLFPNNNKANPYIPTQNITNCQFIDMQPSTEFVTTITSTTPSVAIRSLSNYPLRIENNTIDVKDIIYGYGLYLTANATVLNNTLNNYIYVASENCSIINNNINTPGEFTIFIVNSALNLVIANNTLIGGFDAGELSITGILNDTILENNMPQTSIFIINDENYGTYFDENGLLRTDVVSNGSKIILSGEFINKKFIFDNVKVFVSGENNKLTNTTIITQNLASVLLENINIENDNCNNVFAFLLNSTGNLIRNLNLVVDTNGVLQAIRIEEDKNILTGVTIYMSAAAGDAEWNADLSINNIPTVGILLRSSDNLLNNTKLFLNSTHSMLGATMPSVYGVALLSKATGQYISNNEIRNSRFNVNGQNYVYGLVLAGVKDTYTTLSYYNVSSSDVAYAVQVGDGINNTIAGYIYSYAGNKAYGAYITSNAPSKSINTNFNKLYIQGMDAPEVIAIFAEGADGVELSNATYNLAGDFVKVVDMSKDQNGNMPKNILIYAVNINIANRNTSSIVMNVSDASNITIKNNVILSGESLGLYLYDIVDGAVINNIINLGNITGGNTAVVATGNVVIENNTPIFETLTNDNYDTLFDENGTYIGNATILKLGSDLYNKDLTFFKNASLNFTNIGAYVIYNGTITIKGESTESVTDYYSLNLIGINFNNVDKSVFKDELFGTIQRNVKFDSCNIVVTGDNIVAFDAFNNESYVYLEVMNSNIKMDGNSVIAFNYSGFDLGQELYITYNTFNLTGVNSAIVFFADKAYTKFNDNNVTQKAKNSTTAIIYNSSLSSYSFDSNNIFSQGDNVVVLNFLKGTSGTSYISDNNFTLSSNNPINAINVTGSKTVYVQDNNIIVNALNGEVPVVYVENPNSNVRRNYIFAYDVYGDAAVVAPTVSGNTPKPMNITAEYDTWAIFEENTASFVLTNSSGDIISGNLVAFINGEEVQVVDNTIKYIPTNYTVSVKVIYTDPDNVYVSTNKTFTIPVKMNTNIQVIGADENTVNKTLTLTIILQDQFNNIITGQLVNFTLNGITEVLDMQYGYVLYNYTPSTVGEDNVTISYLGNDQYIGTSKIQIVNVIPNKDEIINELNNTVQEQEVTISELSSTVAKQEETIKKLNDEIKKLKRKTTKIVAKNTNYKASVKTKKFTIILKTVKKAPVTLKINGKTFKATTNSQAKATFKITNLKKRGKYISTIKYAGNSDYKPSSAKVVIIVK